MRLSNALATAGAGGGMPPPDMPRSRFGYSFLRARAEVCALLCHRRIHFYRASEKYYKQDAHIQPQAPTPGDPRAELSVQQLNIISC